MYAFFHVLLNRWYFFFFFLLNENLISMEKKLHFYIENILAKSKVEVKSIQSNELTTTAK